jgi:hypothetical protein
MSTSNNYGNNSRESHHRVVEHKKYVKDQKYVRDRGVESTIYVTAVDGIVKICHQIGLKIRSWKHRL